MESDASVIRHLPSPDNRFRWAERLHSQADFRAVFQQGKRYSAGGLAIWVIRRDAVAVPHPRWAVAISRSYGPAVARNRLKRLLREVFRLHKAQLPRDVDQVVTARPMGKSVTLKHIQDLVFQIWSRAGLLPT